MGKNTNWEEYWSNFNDLGELEEKSINIDDTLIQLEQKVGHKLMSGDHIQIITALEDRIAELEMRTPVNEQGEQGELF